MKGTGRLSAHPVSPTEYVETIVQAITTSFMGNRSHKDSQSIWCHQTRTSTELLKLLNELSYVTGQIILTISAFVWEIFPVRLFPMTLGRFWIQPMLHQKQKPLERDIIADKTNHCFVGNQKHFQKILIVISRLSRHFNFCFFASVMGS